MTACSISLLIALLSCGSGLNGPDFHALCLCFCHILIHYYVLGFVYKFHIFCRATEHFKEAHDLYASYLGPGSNLVADLESRILEVEGYIE